jgi:hypothetical protein
MPRRRRIVRTVEECCQLDQDPAAISVRRIRLSDPQERLLRQIAEGPVEFTGRIERPADTLTEWGFATQGRRNLVEITDRGRRWLAAQPKGRVVA